MNSTNSTTPPNDVRKVIFPYDEKKFAKTISRIKEEILSAIKISVYAPSSDECGQYINILESSLSGDDFSSLEGKAAYTVFEGHYLDLANIGIV